MYGTVLYIDYNKNNIEIYNYLSSKNLDISSVSNCTEALRVIEEVIHDLIIISQDDNIDDLDKLQTLKRHHTTACIPIILISKNMRTNKNIKLNALRAGINDFMKIPIKYDELDLKLQNYFTIADVRRTVLADNAEMKRELSIKKSQIKSTMIDIKNAYSEVIIKLSAAAEYKDPESGNHIARVAHYSKCLAEHAGMDNKFQDQIFFAAPMHDIGKIGIPDRILLKQGPLSKDEWNIMKSHTEIGYAILKEPKDSTLAMSQDIALHHHERFDGSGYPYGLKDKNIPLSARIMAIADVYDALRSCRPYKKSLSHKDSHHIMMNGDDRLKPKHFDPELLNILDKKHKLFEEICEECSNEA